MKLLPTFLLASFFLLFSHRSALPVPAYSPPETIEGRVISYEVHLVNPGETTEGVIYKIRVKLKKGVKPAFIKKGRGTVEVFSSEPLPQWIFNREVLLKIKYVGDERGGRYWIISVKEVK